MLAATGKVLSAADRMVHAAADLLERGGIDAVSTRAVATAAGVQPPAIYRQFGDKDGLLDAVAQFVLRDYWTEKLSVIGGSDDPAVQLHRMWDLHVQFGLDQPHCYVLVFGQSRPGRVLATTTEAYRVLASVLARLGEQGRLTMSVERAASYFRATGSGYILTQIGIPADERDPELSGIMFENTMAALTNGVKPRSRVPATVPARAIALREALRAKPDPVLTPAEDDLLAEWLDRLADA